MPKTLTSAGGHVQDRWDDADAPSSTDPLEQLAYASRLLGSDPSLVLHGGGNTSVKTTGRDVTGEELALVHVKASGHDLGSITSAGFAPLRLERLRSLVELPELDDVTMVNEFRCASIVASAPTASIEALLHALLPYRFVLHSHADAVVTLTDSPLSDPELRDVFGDDVAIVPYIRPGFDLARYVHDLLGRLNSPPAALVLRHHGLFTFADDAKAAYQRHLQLVDAAAAHIAGARTDDLPGRGADVRRPVATEALAALRADVSRAAGFPVLLHAEHDGDVEDFLALPNLTTVTRNGTATLEHVIRTKAWPLIGRDVAGFAREYQERFTRFAARYDGLEPLDPAPRVILDPELGMVSVGRTQGELGATRDIYRHTMRIIRDAEALGGYRSISDVDLFDIEYWELEQAKLKRKGARPPLEGQVAIVLGARGTIPVREALESAGAQTVSVDDGDAADAAVTEAVACWGGVDLACIVGTSEIPASWRTLLTHGWQGGREVRIEVRGPSTVVTGRRGSVTAELSDASRLAGALTLVV